MPSHVLRCEPDGDLYCVWSTVVEAPTFIGSRSDMLGYLLDRGNGPLERLERADRMGSSALWPSEADPFGGWDHGLVYEQRGILPRDKLAALCAVMCTEPYDSDAACDLLRPFEGETEVRRG